MRHTNKPRPPQRISRFQPGRWSPEQPDPIRPSCGMIGTAQENLRKAHQPFGPAPKQPPDAEEMFCFARKSKGRVSRPHGNSLPRPGFFLVALAENTAASPLRLVPRRPFGPAPLSPRPQRPPAKPPLPPVGRRRPRLRTERGPTQERGGFWGPPPGQMETPFWPWRAPFPAKAPAGLHFFFAGC